MNPLPGYQNVTTEFQPENELHRFLLSELLMLGPVNNNITLYQQQE